jgi:hypothetical protein
LASKAEEFASRSLRELLAELLDGDSFLTSDKLQDVLSGLEFFLPTVLRELYEEWHDESMDGFSLILARKTKDGEAEIFGLCIIISDQTLVPIHLVLQVDPTKDEISWLLLKLGEKPSGAPGERVGLGMIRIPYSSHDLALRRIYRLDGNIDRIDWVYKVTFGDRRP